MSLLDLQNFLQTNQETILQIIALLAVLLSCFFLFKYFTKKEIYTQEEIFKLPEAKVLEVKQKHQQTRYIEKTVANNNKDLNRYGRFHVTYKNGFTKTKMGMLSAILCDSSIESYRELK